MGTAVSGILFAIIQAVSRWPKGLSWLPACQMDTFSGMMAFQVADGPATAARMAARTAGGLEVIHYAVSLGHHRSLIYWIGTDDVVGSSFTLEGAQLELALPELLDAEADSSPLPADRYDLDPITPAVLSFDPFTTTMISTSS